MDNDRDAVLRAAAETLALAVFNFLQQINQAAANLQGTVQQIQAVYGPLPLAELNLAPIAAPDDAPHHASQAAAQTQREGHANVAEHPGLRLQVHEAVHGRPEQQRQQQQQQQVLLQRAPEAVASPRNKHLALLEQVHHTLHDSAVAAAHAGEPGAEAGGEHPQGTGGRRSSPDSDGAGSGNTFTTPRTTSPSKPPPPLFTPAPLNVTPMPFQTAAAMGSRHMGQQQQQQPSMALGSAPLRPPPHSPALHVCTARLHGEATPRQPAGVEGQQQQQQQQEQQEQQLQQQQQQQQQQPAQQATSAGGLFHSDSNMKDLAGAHPAPLLRFLSNFSESVAGGSGSGSPAQEGTPTAQRGAQPRPAGGATAAELAAKAGGGMEPVGGGAAGDREASLQPESHVAGHLAPPQHGQQGQQAPQGPQGQQDLLLRLFTELTQAGARAAAAAAAAEPAGSVQASPEGKRKREEEEEDRGRTDTGAMQARPHLSTQQPPSSWLQAQLAQAAELLAQQQQAQQQQQVQQEQQEGAKAGVGSAPASCAAGGTMRAPRHPAAPIRVAASKSSPPGVGSPAQQALSAPPLVVKGLGPPAGPLLSLPAGLGVAALSPTYTWPLTPRPLAVTRGMAAEAGPVGHQELQQPLSEATVAAALAAAVAATAAPGGHPPAHGDPSSPLSVLWGSSGKPGSPDAALSPGAASLTPEPVLTSQRPKRQRVGMEELEAGLGGLRAAAATAASTAAAGVAAASAAAAAREPASRLEHTITHDTSRLGSWTEEDKQELVRLVQLYKPCRAAEWEAIADQLGRWSRGGASAERMYRTLTDPGYHKATNKHGRRLNPRRRIPMHVMACHALRALPGNEGNLSQIAAVIKAHPEFAKELDWSPRPGTKTYPRWKDALVGCFKRGRYPHLIKTSKKEEGLSVYKLDPARLTPAVTQELAKYETPQAGTAAAAAAAAGGAGEDQAAVEEEGVEEEETEVSEGMEEGGQAGAEEAEGR